MAIYKNREVSVNNSSIPLPTSIVNVQYKDGRNENVKLADVHFTQQEKEDLTKKNPSIYANVPVVSEEDLKAVRLGVTPSIDKSVEEQAKLKAQHDKQVEVTQKQVNEAKKKQEKELEKKI